MRLHIISLALFSQVAYGSQKYVEFDMTPSGNADVDETAADLQTSYNNVGAIYSYNMAYNPMTISCNAPTGDNPASFAPCDDGYTCYVCGDDLGCFDKVSKPGALGTTRYTFEVQIPDSYVQKYTESYNLCLWKGVSTPAPLVPVWVATYLADATIFSWDVQYGAIWTLQSYEANVQVFASNSWDVELGDCYSISTDNKRSNCAQSDPNGLVLENTGSADRIGGMYNDVSAEGTAIVGDAIHNVFYASNVLYGSGSVIIEPLEQVTIGVCSYDTSTLVNAQSLATMYTWDVSTDGSDVLVLNEETNTFSCDTCSQVTS